MAAEKQYSLGAMEGWGWGEPYGLDGGEGHDKMEKH